MRENTPTDLLNGALAALAVFVMNDCNSQVKATWFAMDRLWRGKDIMRKLLAFVTIVSTLTACSGGDDNTKGKSANSTAATKSIDLINVKPGLWETKITFKTVDAQSLPEATKQQMIAAMGKGITMKSCVSEEQTEKLGAEFFGSPKGSNCLVEAVNVSGAQMSVKLTCKPGGKTVISSSMTGRFGADYYTMDMQQKTSGTPIGDLITTGRVDGKRLGDCPA
jgi:Protein of unknown function (DUF3617)